MYFQMDKATLLREVISRLKELQNNVAEASEGILIPTDTDELQVEGNKDLLDGASPSIRASICCCYKPGLLSSLRRALDALQLILVKAEIVTLGDRMKNALLIAHSKEQSGEICESLHQTLKSVLDEFSDSEDSLLGAGLSNKRRRVIFDSSYLSA